MAASGKIYTRTELENLKTEEIAEIWLSESEKKDSEKDTEYINLIFTVMQEKNTMNIKQHDIIQYFVETPKENIDISYTNQILGFETEQSENFVSKLISEGKIPQEKAFYALSMEKVAVVYNNLLLSHKSLEVDMKSMKQTLDEINKKIDSKNNAEDLEKIQKQLEIKVNELEATKENLEKAQKQLEEALNTNKDFEDKEKELATAKEKIEELQEFLSTIKTEKEKLDKEFIKLKNTHSNFLIALSNQLSIHEGKINPESIENAIEEIKQNQSSSNTNSLEAENKTLKDKIDSLKEENNTLTNSINELEEKANSKEALEMSLNKAKEELATAKEKIEELTLKQSVSKDEDFENISEEKNEQSEDQKTKSTNLKSNNIKGLFKGIVIASSLVAAITAGYLYFPKDKLNTLIDLTSIETIVENQNSNNLPKLDEEVSVLDEKNVNVVDNKTKQIKTSTSNTLINDDPFMSSNIEFEENVENNTPNQKVQVNEVVTFIEPQVKKVKTETSKPVKKLTNEEILETIRKQIKVTPNKKIVFNNKTFDKNEKIQGFEIVYITDDFILFRDNVEETKVHRIVL